MPVAGAVISAGVGLMQARRAGKDAQRAQAGEDAARRESLAIQREQMGFGRGLIDEWKTNFLPMLGDLKDMAYEEQRPDFAGISADVGAAFDTSRGIGMRNAQRMGVKPTDGAYQAAETQYGLGRASTLVDARNKARQAVKDSRFNRMGQVFGMSGALANMGTGIYTGGAAGASNVLGGTANSQAYRASNAQQAQGEGMGAVGAGLGGVLEHFWPGG